MADWGEGELGGYNTNEANPIKRIDYCLNLQYWLCLSSIGTKFHATPTLPGR
jgi:hypothetical protein